jgi:hypothetical protein
MSLIRFNEIQLYIEQIQLDQQLVRVKLTEALYGEVPTLDLEIQRDELPLKVNDEVNGYIIYPTGRRQDFSGYVYSLSYYNSKQEIKIILMDKQMLKEPKVGSHKGIINAIRSSYNGIILTPFDHDEPLNDKIFQKNESNYSYCMRCCWSYAYDVIFGITMSGLKFIDLKSIEPIDVVDDRGNFHIEGTPEFSQSKLYDNEADEVDMTVGYDETRFNVMFYDKIVTVNQLYRTATQNYLHNTRYKTSKLQFQVSSTQLFPYEIGDCLRVDSAQINFKQVFISKRIIEVEQKMVKIFYTLQSVEL